MSYLVPLIIMIAFIVTIGIAILGSTRNLLLFIGTLTAVFVIGFYDWWPSMMVDIIEEVVILFMGLMLLYNANLSSRDSIAKDTIKIVSSALLIHKFASGPIGISWAAEMVSGVSTIEYSTAEVGATVAILLLCGAVATMGSKDRSFLD